MTEIKNFLADYVWNNIAMEEFLDYADEITENAQSIYNSFKALCNDGVNDWESAEIAVRRFVEAL